MLPVYLLLVADFIIAELGPETLPLGSYAHLSGSVSHNVPLKIGRSICTLKSEPPRFEVTYVGIS